MAKRILIVDDDMYIRELYEEVLKDAGFDVDTAADGREGLSKMSAGGYDLILLDVMMPEIDGIGVLTEIQKNPPKQKNGPTILLTNLSHDPVIKQGISKGAASFLIKADITPDQLLEEAKKLIN